MANLLTYNQQIAITKLSSNNSGKFDALCKEVELTDLKDLLGLALLQNLQTNPTTPDNVKLLDGDSFTNYKNQTVRHQGIRFVLAYLNKCRYIGESFAADTFTGFVQKNNENSQPISEGSIKRLQGVAKEIALSEFENIKEYLNLNSTNYPLWIVTDSKKPYTPKFDNISKTQYNSQIGDMRCPTNGKRYV